MDPEFLGKKFRDVVTGFEGTCIGDVHYLTGCRQILLIPTVGEDGKRRDGEWFDDDRLEVIDDKPLSLPGRIAKALKGDRSTGFDQQAPQR